MKSSNAQMNQLSRESLKIALIHLLGDRTLAAVTVTELCKKAGVSRMAFYRNYESIQELYHEIYDDYFQQFFQKNFYMLEQNDLHGFWESLFVFIYDHQKTAKVLLSSKEDQHFLAYLNRTFCDQIHDLDARYYFYGVVGFVFNMIGPWVASDFSIDPHRLALICQQIQQAQVDYRAINPGVDTYLGN